MTETTPMPKAAPVSPQEPVDAASLVIVDDSDHGELRVLMGQRSARQTFMPDRFVFPGGRVEPDDLAVAFCPEADLAAIELRKLQLRMLGTASDVRARALGLASVRECAEEAGVIVGSLLPAGMPPESGGSSPASTQPAAFQPSWCAGYAPRLAPLTYFARAITPPGRTRRFDTRFFALRRCDIAAETGSDDGELRNLDWYALSAIERLNLAPITRAILRELLDRLNAGALEPSRLAVPFYHQDGDAFVRELLDIASD
ncbi:MAG: NUDIX hydrolase [Hyphomicrobiaceae bacterium]